MNPIIEVRNVRRVFRSVKKEEGIGGAFKVLFNPEHQEHAALKGVSFSIHEGTFNGLIGANGAGKTTLLKILSGLIPPSSGEARVLGIDPFTRPMHFRKQISLVMGQKAQLWWDLPGIDAFDLIRAIYEIPTPLYKERLNELADMLDVKDHLNTQIRRLSLGERMKMELIGALLHWPKIIFLDEPTIGLDVLAAAKLRDFLKTFNQKEKSTIILTSHNMDDIEKLCSRVLIMREGEMIYDGSPEKLTHSGEQRLRIRFKTEVPVADLVRVTGIPEGAISQGETEESDEEEEEGESANSGLYYFTIKKEQIVPTLQVLMPLYPITDMGIEEASLESVIQRIYSTDKNTQVSL